MATKRKPKAEKVVPFKMVTEVEVFNIENREEIDAYTVRKMKEHENELGINHRISIDGVLEVNGVPVNLMQENKIAVIFHWLSK